MLRIKLQTHKGIDFGDGTNAFSYKGFILKSLESTGMRKSDDGFFVLPYIDKDVNSIIVVNKNEERWLERLTETVKAYNRHFNGYKSEPDVDVID